MRRALNMEVIFPIKDAASAALMTIKADYLRKAGIISEWEERWVYSRAHSFLDDDSLIPPNETAAVVGCLVVPLADDFHGPADGVFPDLAQFFRPAKMRPHRRPGQSRTTRLLRREGR
jgi:hypothetical protein